MRIISFLLRRALWPEKGSLSTFALWISVAGVALGVAQLMLVLSVMSGFQGMLERNYTRISSHMVIIPPLDARKNPGVRRTVERIPGVAAVTPFFFGQGMVLKQGVGGVVLEGVELRDSHRVTNWSEIWMEPPLEEIQNRQQNWMWVGAQLAKKLRIRPGDTVRVLIAEGTRKRILPFVVTAITKFGIYEHDLRYARVDLRYLEEIFRREAMEPMYKVKLRAAASLPRVMRDARDALDEEIAIKSWTDINQNIFLAVQHQKGVLFLVLEIIVALAAVNVVNLLTISTQNRRRDIAILRAMGMRFWEVVTFFVAKGSAIGMLGVGVGIGLGLAICKGVERFQPELLSETIYNVTRLPIRIAYGDVLLIGAVAFAMCVLFSVLPALKAAWQRPVEALRYE